jgi:hypothetical protein
MGGSRFHDSREQNGRLNVHALSGSLYFAVLSKNLVAKGGIEPETGFLLQTIEERPNSENQASRTCADEYADNAYRQETQVNGCFTSSDLVEKDSISSHLQSKGERFGFARMKVRQSGDGWKDHYSRRLADPRRKIKSTKTWMMKGMMKELIMHSGWNPDFAK